MTTKFKKDLKKVGKGTNNELIGATLKLLEARGIKGIPKEMKPHKLKGEYKNNWEFHLKPDLLIICVQFVSPNVIRLIRIGSHSELFK